MVVGLSFGVQVALEVWRRHPAAVRALVLSPGETAIVVIDREGRLAIRERGHVALWKLDPLRDLLSLPERR